MTLPTIPSIVEVLEGTKLHSNDNSLDSSSTTGTLR